MCGLPFFPLLIYSLGSPTKQDRIFTPDFVVILWCQSKDDNDGKVGIGVLTSRGVGVWYSIRLKS